MRSRSRSKQVRSSSGSSGTLRLPAPELKVASGRSSTRSRSSRAVRPMAAPGARDAEESAWARTTPPPSWADVTWMREQWAQLDGGPFLLKGVCRVDDARRAVDAGVTAISVSNHGGNNLDGTPATIRMVKPVADAVGDQIEVLLDGGIRRGRREPHELPAPQRAAVLPVLEALLHVDGRLRGRRRRHRSRTGAHEEESGGHGGGQAGHARTG